MVLDKNPRQKTSGKRS